MTESFSKRFVQRQSMGKRMMNCSCMLAVQQFLLSMMKHRVFQLMVVGIRKMTLCSQLASLRLMIRCFCRFFVAGFGTTSNGLEIQLNFLLPIVMGLPIVMRLPIGMCKDWLPCSILCHRLFSSKKFVGSGVRMIVVQCMIVVHGMAWQHPSSFQRHVVVGMKHVQLC